MVLNTAVYYTVYRRRSSERLYRASLYDCVNFRLHAAVYFIHVLNIACCFVRRVSYVSDSVGRACVEILCSQLGGGSGGLGGCTPYSQLRYCTPPVRRKIKRRLNIIMLLRLLLARPTRLYKYDQSCS